MGVTLERVQNKFACIIGELCNEPVVLSQFAIWVDLRIAEYKAKGAISLDCSGDEPDPVWMNGHRLPKRTERNHSRNSTERRSRHSQNYPPDPPSDTGFLNEGRMSPELLLIKEEPGVRDSSSVFPVSIHPHNAPNPSPRKRPVSETLSRSDDNFYSHDTSTAKLQRLSSSHSVDNTPVMAPDNTSNQSLMSIISGEQNQTADISSSDIDVILDYENKAAPLSSQQQQQQQHDQQNSSFTSQPTASSSYDNNDSFQRDNTNTPGGELRGHPSPKRHRPKLWGCYLQELKQRILNVDEKPKASVRNIVNAVGSLERWLKLEKGELRKVEDIPYTKLDPYLQEFFPQLKQSKTRLDYDPASFLKFRHYLDRFLKEASYPYSICKSPSFSASQTAFHAKLETLYKKKVLGQVGKYNYNVSHLKPSSINWTLPNFQQQQQQQQSTSVNDDNSRSPNPQIIE